MYIQQSIVQETEKCVYQIHWSGSQRDRSFVILPISHKKLTQRERKNVEDHDLPSRNKDPMATTDWYGQFLD